MVNVQIPESLDYELQQAAARSGRTKDDLLREVITAHLEEDFAAHGTFTDEQMAIFRLSLDQIKRGEIYTSEQIDELFKDWFKKLDAR